MAAVGAGARHTAGRALCPDPGWPSTGATGRGHPYPAGAGGTGTDRPSGACGRRAICGTGGASRNTGEPCRESDSESSCAISWQAPLQGLSGLSRLAARLVAPSQSESTSPSSTPVGCSIDAGPSPGRGRRSSAVRSSVSRCSVPHPSTGPICPLPLSLGPPLAGSALGTCLFAVDRSSQATGERVPTFSPRVKLTGEWGFTYRQSV